MRSYEAPVIVIAVVLLLAGHASARDDRQLGIGTPVKEGSLRAWNIDVAPDGAGLPPGQGTVAQGETVYAKRCALCHGKDGDGQPMDRLVGGQGTLTSAAPVKTIGSYWPYATTVFDYVRRAMPLDAPQSLTADQVYAVTAYLLHLNGLLGHDATVNAETLPQVKMPNHAAFRGDPRPDTGAKVRRVARPSSVAPRSGRPRF